MATTTLTVSSRKPNLLDACNEASILASKLNALLAMTYGEQGESFRNMNDAIQDEYMWACSDMATDLRELVGKLNELNCEHFKQSASA